MRNLSVKCNLQVINDEHNFRTQPGPRQCSTSGKGSKFEVLISRVLMHRSLNASESDL